MITFSANYLHTCRRMTSSQNIGLYSASAQIRLSRLS
jgi:hypothetical protein